MAAQETSPPYHSTEVARGLKLIGRLRVNDKICIRHMSIQQNGLFTSLLRRVTGECRQATLEFVERTVRSALELLRTYGPSRQNSATYLEEDLRKCLDGLNNLHRTYHDDTQVSVTTEMLCQQIESALVDRGALQKVYIDKGAYCKTTPYGTGTHALPISIPRSAGSAGSVAGGSFSAGGSPGPP